MDPQALPERDARIARVLASLSPLTRRYVLELLVAGEDLRAKAIGRLFVDGRTRELAEMLVDLEDDRTLALDVAQALRASLVDATERPV